MDSQAHSHCHDEDGPSKKSWKRNPLVWTSLAIFLFFGASSLFSSLEPLRLAFLDYLGMIALPIAIGFVLGGLIDYYVPKEYVSKLLAHKTKKTVFIATGLGFFMSACSHGILALSMELHKKGASGPAVVSFLLASPWANLPITILLIGFFGWKGFLIVAAALFVAVNTGLGLQFLDSIGWIETNPHSITVHEDFSIRSDIAARWKRYEWTPETFGRDLRGVWKGMRSLIDMVLWWILIGLILASLASAYVPASFFVRYFGPSVLGLVMTLIAATILEVCSEGTSPLAFELYRQTGAFGNAFAFLMGGVVTDYTEIGLVWINVGKRTALWMVGLALPQVIALAWLFNVLF